MEEHELIAADDFCTYYNAEYSFIQSLHQSGLVEIITVSEKRFINANQLQDLEKFVHLHYDMDINIEGIETINHLLQQVKSMQEEISGLKNKLRYYEQRE